MNATSRGSSSSDAADRPNRLRQRAVGHHDVGPDAVEDLLPRHGPVALLHQQQQQVEVPRDERDLASSSHSTRRAGDRTNRSEAIPHRRMLRRPRRWLECPAATSHRAHCAEDFSAAGLARLLHGLCTARRLVGLGTWHSARDGTTRHIRGITMSISRLLAIAAIFILATLAWLTLGTSIVARTGEFDSRLGQQVAQLWGGEHRQVAPRVWVQRPRQVTEQVRDGGRDGKVDHEDGQRDHHRQRAGAAGAKPHRGRPEAGPSPEGAALVRHVRRRVSAAGTRSATPTRSSARLGWSSRFRRRRPSTTVQVPREPAGGRPRQRPVERACARGSRVAGWRRSAHRGGLRVPRARQVELRVCRTRASSEVTDFVLKMTTDFADVDFPAGTMSPTRKQQRGPDGWALVAIRQPGHRPAGRHGPAEPRQSRPAGRAHHGVCPGLAAVLSGRHGDPRRPAAAATCTR